MKRTILTRLSLDLMMLYCGMWAMAQGIVGTWKGNIQEQSYSIPLVLNIGQNE